jgi:hypothetical protein
MSFNMQDYTTVAERIKIFWELHPEGAISTDLIDHSNQRFIVKLGCFAILLTSCPLLRDTRMK